MNIVFCLDDNYVPPLKVMLTSMLEQHEPASLDIYIIHTAITKKSMRELDELVSSKKHRLHEVDCTEYLDALVEELNIDLEALKVNRYYTLEMYLWLFAPDVLPNSIDKVLYLDPDMVCLNSADKLYNLDFGDHLFIASSFDYKNNFAQVFNNLRLGNYTSTRFFNTGMVFINLKKWRQFFNPKKIIHTIIDKGNVLLLPDQDIFNYLYEKETIKVPWLKYNLDPRPFDILNLIIPSEYNRAWVEQNAVFIHYCGKNKPWIERDEYKYKLGEYWFEYEQKLKKYEESKA